MGCILSFHLVVISNLGNAPEPVGILDYFLFNCLRIFPGIMSFDNAGNFIGGGPIVAQFFQNLLGNSGSLYFVDTIELF